jgi:hypothetical protein
MDFERFDPQRNDAQPVRQRYGFADSDTILLFMGRIYSFFRASTSGSRHRKAQRSPPWCQAPRGWSGTWLGVTRGTCESAQCGKSDHPYELSAVRRNPSSDPSLTFVCSPRTTTKTCNLLLPSRYPVRYTSSWRWVNQLYRQKLRHEGVWNWEWCDVSRYTEAAVAQVKTLTKPQLAHENQKSHFYQTSRLGLGHRGFPSFDWHRSWRDYVTLL